MKKYQLIETSNSLLLKDSKGAVIQEITKKITSNRTTRQRISIGMWVFPDRLEYSTTDSNRITTSLSEFDSVVTSYLARVNEESTVFYPGSVWISVRSDDPRIINDYLGRVIQRFGHQAKKCSLSVQGIRVADAHILRQFSLVEHYSESPLPDSVIADDDFISKAGNLYLVDKSPKNSLQLEDSFNKAKRNIDAGVLSTHIRPHEDLNSNQKESLHLELAEKIKENFVDKNSRLGYKSFSDITHGASRILEGYPPSEVLPEVLPACIEFAGVLATTGKKTEILENLNTRPVIMPVEKVHGVPISKFASSRDMWDSVKSTWENAASYAKSLVSKGVFGRKVDKQTRSLRILSCHGIDDKGNRVAEPCAARGFSGDYHYCNQCGCGQREAARLSESGSKRDAPVFDESKYDKLDFPYLECPRKKRGFSNYEGDENVRDM